MSTVISISTRRRYGVSRVCRVWAMSRAGVYRQRSPVPVPAVPRRRPGPQGPMPDAALVEAIREILCASPFHGEGYRKVWARLRHKGIRTSKERVRRLMRENALSAGRSGARLLGPRSHDGTIIPETIDAMWGADMTATVRSRSLLPSITARPNASASMPPSAALGSRPSNRSGRAYASASELSARTSPPA